MQPAAREVALRRRAEKARPQRSPLGAPPARPRRAGVRRPLSPGKLDLPGLFASVEAEMSAEEQEIADSV